MEPSTWNTYSLNHSLEVLDHRSPYKMLSKGIRKNQVIWIVPGITGFSTGKVLVAPLLLKCVHYNGCRCDRPAFSAFGAAEEVFTIFALQLLLCIDDSVFEIHIGPWKS